MRIHLAFFLMVHLLVAGIAAGSSPLYWAEGGMPARVVIGTLVDIEEDAFFLGGRDGSAYRVNWDAGWIEVERVLEGYLGHERVPVVWCARIESTRPGSNVITKSSGTSTHVEGERRIWVLFTPGRFSDPHHKHYEFQAFPLDSLPRIERELEELRIKSRNSILD